MIEDIHKYGRLYALLPGMVAKRLAQAVTADIRLKMQRPPGRTQDSVGLAAAQGLFPAPSGKNEHFLCHFGEAFSLEI